MYIEVALLAWKIVRKYKLSFTHLFLVSLARVDLKHNKSPTLKKVQGLINNGGSLV